MGSENGGRRSGRKKSKSKEQGNKKKEPQRGMGVAQLEYIRTRGEDSGSRKVTEFNINPNPNPFHPQTSHQFFPAAPYFGEAAARNYGVMNNNGPGLVVQRVGNGVLLGPAGQNFSGAGMVYNPEQFPVDHYSAPNSIYQSASAGNVNMSCEIPRDISYVPNIKYSPAVCPKKKRYNIGEVGEGSGDASGKNSYGCLFRPITGGNYKTNNSSGQIQGFGPKPPMNHGFPGGGNINLQEAGAAVFKHNIYGGSFGGSSSNVLMEYDFFPEKEKLGGEKSSEFENWIKLGSESSSVAVVGGEANSCLTTTTSPTTTAFAASSSSSSIDLSLKLSID